MWHTRIIKSSTCQYGPAEQQVRLPPRHKALSQHQQEPVEKGSMEDDEEDVVVEEYDVVVCPASVATVCVLGHPLRPPWRPYNYDDVRKVRMKHQAHRLEVDLPLSNSPQNYNSEGTEGYKQIEHVTLRSQQVEQHALLALGVIQDGKLLLAPVDMMLQMRPNLAHLNVMKKGDGEGGEDGEEEDEGGESHMRAVEVQVQKRETERQQQARLNSYAYLAKKEEEEPWKDMKLHMDNTQVADKVWERLMKPPTDAPPTAHLSRSEYLAAFAPAACSPDTQAPPLGGDAQGRGSGGGEAAPQPTLAALTDACKMAFTTAVQALFAKHSVCSLQNVRQWLLEPKHSSGDALKAAAAAAREAALLEDKQLHELMLSTSGLPLACIRRMYVLKQTGRPETDAFRRVVVELLQDKEGFRRHEVTELANAQGVVVTDSLYSKVLKDMCVNRANTWSLRNGADI